MPIGCRKDPEEKCHLLIAEDTRWIIEKIYALAVRGVGAAKTSKVLTQEKGSTPGWLNYQRKGTFANIYANAPEGKAYAWTIAQVKSILEDETYIENSVHYRETNISNKNKKRIRKDPSEWVRVEGTHEVIISKDVFDRVQEQVATRRRYMNFLQASQMRRLWLVYAFQDKTPDQETIQALRLQPLWTTRQSVFRTLCPL